MDTINFDNISWGDWGTYTFKKFMLDFSSSEEFMRASFEGYYSHTSAVEDLLSNSITPGNSLTPELPISLYKFATRTVPHRLEDITGTSVVYNPQRDCRDGARPSVPKQAPDILKWILEGEKGKGNAIVLEFDQETRLGYDDFYLKDIPLRKLNKQDAHAVTIINKFPAYVRIMDDKLVQLLDKIGFLSRGKFKDGKPSVLKTIPFGLNFVSFPFDYADSLSEMPVYNLYSTMKSTQRTLKRAFESTDNSDSPYDVFFNIGCLAGGTIPRIHMQTYFRTKQDPDETYDYHEEGKVSLRYFAESDLIEIEPGNRNWNAYIPQIKTGRFDIRFELKNQRQKKFADLGDIELWDLAEMLVYHSNILDEVIGIPERNIQFFPTGIIIRPFAVDGGHEKTRPELIQGQPAYQFGRTYNEIHSKILKDKMYAVPRDKRGSKNFKKLIDESSPILRKIA